MMKVFLEADFSKGKGAIRWKGVTRARLCRIILSTGALVAAVLVSVPLW